MVPTLSLGNDEMIRRKKKRRVLWSPLLTHTHTYMYIYHFHRLHMKCCFFLHALELAVAPITDEIY